MDWIYMKINRINVKVWHVGLRKFMRIEERWCDKTVVCSLTDGNSNMKSGRQLWVGTNIY